MRDTPSQTTASNGQSLINPCLRVIPPVSTYVTDEIGVRGQRCACVCGGEGLGGVFREHVYTPLPRRWENQPHQPHHPHQPPWQQPTEYRTECTRVPPSLSSSILFSLKDLKDPDIYNSEEGSIVYFVVCWHVEECVIAGVSLLVVDLERTTTVDLSKPCKHGNIQGKMACSGSEIWTHNLRILNVMVTRVLPSSREVYRKRRRQKGEMIRRTNFTPKASKHLVLWWLQSTVHGPRDGGMIHGAIRAWNTSLHSNKI